MVRSISCVLFAWFALTSLVTGQEKQSKCWDTAMTTDVMHRCADQDARDADAELNKTYQLLLSKAKGQPKVLAKLKAAERAWLAYRDAQLEAVFPSEQKQAVYGSMFPICYLQVATELTKQRTAELRRMIDAWGDIEGEGAGCYY